jgi:hypothetical protein
MALTDAGVAALRGCKTNSGGAQPREEQRRESKRDRNRGRAGISVDEVERGKVGGGKERWETDHARDKVGPHRTRGERWIRRLGSTQSPAVYNYFPYGKHAYTVRRCG